MNGRKKGEGSPFLKSIKRERAVREMEVSPDTLEWRDAYKLLIGSILPRPIAFVSTVDENGIANAAPLAFLLRYAQTPCSSVFHRCEGEVMGQKRIHF